MEVFVSKKQFARLISICSDLEFLISRKYKSKLESRTIWENISSSTMHDASLIYCFCFYPIMVTHMPYIISFLFNIYVYINQLANMRLYAKKMSSYTLSYLKLFVIPKYTIVVLHYGLRVYCMCSK